MVAHKHDGKSLAERLHALHDELHAFDPRLHGDVIRVRVHETEFASRLFVLQDQTQNFLSSRHWLIIDGLGIRRDGSLDVSSPLTYAKI